MSTGPLPVTTVVFDADETLVDLRAAVRGALEEVLDELRRLTPVAAALTMADLDEDWEKVFAVRYADPVTEIRRAALERTLARVGLTAELDRICELFFTRRFALTRPYPQARPTLTALRRWYAVGFATNGNSRADRCGLAGEFAFEVYAHVDGVPKKPAPRFFEAVVAAARCPAASIVHVGDSLAHDVLGARAAGLRAIWLNRAARPRPPGVTVEAEIRALVELPDALRRLDAG